MTKISQLVDIGANLAANDEFIIRDVSEAGTPNKKVTSSGFVDYIVAQGTGAGFTQIAAGVGPLARVRTISSGTTGTILFETANGGSIVERGRVDPAGRFLAGLTSANTSGAKLQTSDGLTFPATQVASADPNTLDDYEEGTWTPTIVGTTTAGTATYVTQNAAYTKVGRVVTISFYLNYSGGTGTGNLRINGLPFTAAASYFAASFTLVDQITLSANNILTGLVDLNTSFITCIGAVVGGGSYTNVAYDAGGQLIGTCTYFTT